MSRLSGWAILFFTLTLLSCETLSAEEKGNTGYDLTKPDTLFTLPDTLREISGLTIIDSTSFACIQDENGIIFFYDAFKNKIKRQFTFHSDGDYEEIARVEDTIYVLQSDGVLFKITGFESDSFTIGSYITGIPANNNEGLCYDKENNRLLIGCKSKTGKGIENKNKRAIYAFDLNTKLLSEKPVFEFDLQVINQFVVENKIKLPLHTKKNGHTGTPIKFRTSAICIHPLTKKLFLLSAADHMLFIFDMKGKIEYLEVLDPELFNKSEGITFFENGTMLITNEAQHKKPTLLRFSPRL